MHPVFERFRGYVGPVEAGVPVDWIGARHREEWDHVAGSGTPAEDMNYVPAPQPRDEEYFEWISLLEAVVAAQDRFVMLEVGAGYGRWGVRGALAARQRGIKDIEIHFAEAEPQHAAWIAEAIRLNGLADIRRTITQGAVAYGRRTVPFLIAAGELEASNWYGQNIGEEGGSDTDRTYFGRPVARNSSGYDQIEVRAVTLEELLQPHERWNLVDIDAQGAEREIAEHSMDVLTAKVERVHIGTHAADIDDLVRSRFTAAGWSPVWDFPCNREHATPYGTVLFQDGVQAWTNPHIGA